MNYKKNFLFLLAIVLMTFCFRNVNAQNQQKDYSEALKFYQDALREKPDKNEIVFYLAAVYDHYYRDKSVAINYYKKFLSSAKTKIDTNLLKYAKSRIDVLIEENHFSKPETSN